MLHTMFPGILPAGFNLEKKVFKGFLPYMGMAAILVM